MVVLEAAIATGIVTLAIRVYFGVGGAELEEGRVTSVRVGSTWHSPR
jgi:hypothetical protein